MARATDAVVAAPAAEVTIFISRIVDAACDNRANRGVRVSTEHAQVKDELRSVGFSVSLGTLEAMPMNVLGGELELCSSEPLTGITRNGCCEMHPADAGFHIVCAVVTNTFLAYSKEQGNDLTTPRPEYGFEGLSAGDRWCLCASRWVEAHEAGKAPKVVLESTSANSLEWIDIADLRANAI